MEDNDDIARIFAQAILIAARELRRDVIFEFGTVTDVDADGRVYVKMDGAADGTSIGPIEVVGG